MTEQADDQQKAKNLIVIGASAGGIEALSALVGSLPEEFPAPIVIAQHLSPHRLSSLAEILARRTSLPIRTVTGPTPLEPGVIYVVPPNRDVVITDHEVSVQEDDGGGPRPSVDLLFRSAASIFGEDLIAVILSGSGSDGSAGAREVKQAGGTVIVQNPESASFPGMPLSLAPTIVDIVATPDRIGGLLKELLSGTYVVEPPTDDAQLRSFLDQLRDESGIDFTTYKTPTIMRRLQRRIVATGQANLGEYIRHIRRNPDERQRLIASFLIKVTEFFRDPELFAYLRDQVLPELIEDARRRDAELRLWSAGCATGEEAYSLAMLVAELTGEDEPVPARIFATDLDSEAVAFARQGIYPARALLSVPMPMVERFFTQHNGEYEVKKTLRSLLVFGDHDLGQRAPFPRIDLVLCRNVLIYFTAALQRRALQLFAFSLRPGGYLALGKSESVSPLAEYFAVDQPRVKVYRRIGDRALIPPTRIKESIPLLPTRVPQFRAGLVAGSAKLGRPARESVRPRGIASAEQVVLGLPVGVVVVNRDYDIQSINSLARRIFAIHTSAMDRDFVHLLQHFPASRIRQLIDQAFAGNGTGPVMLTSESAPHEPLSVIELTTSLLTFEQNDDDAVYVAITAADVTEREQLRRVSDGAEATHRRLAAANEEVLAANVELTGTISRLRAENEELLVSTEELQAATEEVETLNEELQASNEELETLNEELQATIEELNTTNDDLQARTVELQEMAFTSDLARSHLESVLASIGDAVAVVDESGVATLTNHAYERLVETLGDAALEDNDGNRLPLEATPLKRAARHEAFTVSFSATTSDGTRRWFEADGRPLSRDGNTLGVVAIRDVTERSLRHLQDQWMGIASHELRTPLTAMQAYLQMAARSLSVESDNRTRRYFDRAMTQIRRMDNLVSQLIDVTRFQQSRLILDRSRIDLGGVVKQAVETIEALAPDKTIEVEDATTDPAIIIGDQIRLEQVVLNLMMNAVHHAPRSERIVVRLRRLDGCYELQVHDDGPGIPVQEQATIFDRFSRGAGVQSAGLGLGLFIARVLVNEHGGSIELESSADTGTTFTVRLPVAPDDLTAA